jgi:hypothetical protein
MCGDWQEVSPTSAGGVVSPMNGDETPAQMKAKLEGVVGKLRDLLAKHKALLVSRLLRKFRKPPLLALLRAHSRGARASMVFELKSALACGLLRNRR